MELLVPRRSYNGLMEAYADLESRCDRKLAKLQKRVNRVTWWLVSMLSLSLTANAAQFYLYYTIINKLTV